MQQPLRIGARASKLSRTQTAWVQTRLAAALGAAPEEADAVAPVVPITTTGDRIQDRRLLEAGGKALFTKEIEEALLDGRIDLAVHSLKDVPALSPPGLVIGATPAREDPRDALVAPGFDGIEALPYGARLGTASLRRQAQCLATRPDLTVVMTRGNVDTRLGKLRQGECDALLLAFGGLRRLGLQDLATGLIDPAACPPAPGQGALAVQCRADDRLAPWILALNDPETAVCVAAERGALEALEGSCRTAMGAYAHIDQGRLHLVIEALTADGAQRWRRAGTVAVGPDADPQPGRDLGFALGCDLKAEAGDRLTVV